MLKPLNDGTFSEALTVIAEAREGKVLQVALISVVNNSGATVTYNLYQNVTGTDRLVSSKDCELEAGARDEHGPFSLDAGDQIKAAANSAGKLDFVVTGEESDR